MKKLFFIPFLFLFQLSFAQKFYVGLDGAYMIPVVPDVVGVIYNNQSTNISSSGGSSSVSLRNYDAVKGSYTSGISTGGFLGYYLNENISFEAGISYLFANEVSYSSNHSYISISSFGSTTNITDNIDYKVKLKLINVYPAVKFSLPNKFVTTFIRTGFLYGISSMTQDITEIQTGSTNQTNDDSRLTTLNSYGIFNSIGIEKKFAEHFKIFAEWTFRYQTFSPIKDSYTKSNINGVDQLPTMTVSQKETEYVDSYSTSSSSSGPTVDPNQPRKSIAYKQTFNSMGLQVGIIYEFGFKKAPVTK